MPTQTRMKVIPEPSLGRTLRQFVEGLLVAALLIWAFLAQPYRLVINHTASEPEGVYLLHRLSSGTILHRGELVSFRYEAPWPTPPYTTYPNGTGFLKRLAGVPGDRVNSDHGRYTLIPPNGHRVTLGVALSHTPSGVPVPHRAHFHHQIIPARHYYMAGDGNPESYDSRYYGLIARDRIIGTARLLWAW